MQLLTSQWYPERGPTGGIINVVFSLPQLGDKHLLCRGVKSSEQQPPWWPLEWILFTTGGTGWAGPP